MARILQTSICLNISCISFSFCMFITSSYFLADMPKAKTEHSDFTISWAKILLAQQWENKHINMMDPESAFAHNAHYPENKGEYLMKSRKRQTSCYDCRMRLLHDVKRVGGLDRTLPPNRRPHAFRRVYC
jgi:hypothetical protein